MDRIENIKNLYTKINTDRKQDFFKEVAKEFEIEPSSVRVGWFTRYDIPKKYRVRDRLIEFMQKYIALQNSCFVE